jgi:hypothetical protein
MTTRKTTTTGRSRSPTGMTTRKATTKKRKPRRWRGFLAKLYISIIANRVELIPPKFSANLSFGLLWLQGFPRIRGLDKIFEAAQKETLHPVFGCRV